MSGEALEQQEWSDAMKAKAVELSELVAREKYKLDGSPHELFFLRD